MRYAAAVRLKGRPSGRFFVLRAVVVGMACGSVSASAQVRVDLGKAETRGPGTIDPEEILKEICGRLGVVRACYEEELARDPQAHGRVTVRVIIGVDGHVRSAGLGLSTMRPPLMTQCLLEQVRKWVFPVPTGGEVGFSYPFIFVGNGASGAADRGPSSSAIGGAGQLDGALKEGLDKEIIRRVIQAHIASVRRCYEKALVRKPKLEGRVMAEFTITETGAVTDARIESTTLNRRTVELCIVEAIERWEFPKPEGGGRVVVQYPFVLKTGPGLRPTVTLE